jgi:hypothetical protein
MDRYPPNDFRVEGFVPREWRLPAVPDQEDASLIWSGREAVTVLFLCPERFVWGLAGGENNQFHIPVVLNVRGSARAARDAEALMTLLKRKLGNDVQVGLKMSIIGDGRADDE